jgi:fatty-acyl-CoA synthase
MLDKTDLSSLELLLYGASDVAEPVGGGHRADRSGILATLRPAECYPVSVLRKADHDPKTPELFLSCGFPSSACEVKLFDDDDHKRC